MIRYASLAGIRAGPWRWALNRAKTLDMHKAAYGMQGRACLTAEVLNPNLLMYTPTKIIAFSCVQ